MKNELPFINWNTVMITVVLTSLLWVATLTSFVRELRDEYDLKVEQIIEEYEQLMPKDTVHIKAVYRTDENGNIYFEGVY